MSCIAPITIYNPKAHTPLRSFDVACGRCLNCLVTKQSQLTFLANKELLDVYSRGQGASFVTLTYDDEHIPVNDNGLVTLRKADLQKWLKNMRRQMEYYNEKIPFKYVACGELGDETSRPHYHICLLGLTDVQVSKYTRKLWKHGLCDIGVLSAGGLRYVVKYMTKSHPTPEIKAMRKALGVENPFVCHSVGLGKDWILRNLDRIVEDEFTFYSRGKKCLFPKYVCQYVSVRTGVNYIPYARKFALSDRTFEALGIEKSEYDFDKAYLSYKQKVAVLRAKNEPVDDYTLSKHWYRSPHYKDRVPFKDSFIDYALYGDVVPF